MCAITPILRVFSKENSLAINASPSFQCLFYYQRYVQKLYSLPPFYAILHVFLQKLLYYLTHLEFHSQVFLPLFFPRVGVSNSQCNEALALVCAPDELP